MDTVSPLVTSFCTIATSLLTTVKENEIRSSYSWSVGATLAVTAENFTAIPAETPLEGATHLLVPWKLRLVRWLGIPSHGGLFVRESPTKCP